MVELLGRTHLSKQTLSRLLNELLAEGLIKRRANARDRRQRLLELTDAGAARGSAERAPAPPSRARLSRRRGRGGGRPSPVLLGLIEDGAHRHREVD